MNIYRWQFSGEELADLDALHGEGWPAFSYYSVEYNAAWWSSTTDESATAAYLRVELPALPESARRLLTAATRPPRLTER